MTKVNYISYLTHHQYMKITSYFFLFIFFCNTLNSQITVTEVSTITKKISNNAVCEGFINETANVFTFGGIDPTKMHGGIHLKSYRYNTQTGESIQIPGLADTLGKIAAATSRIYTFNL